MRLQKDHPNTDYLRHAALVLLVAMVLSRATRGQPDPCIRGLYVRVSAVGWERFSDTLHYVDITHRVPDMLC